MQNFASRTFLVFAVLTPQWEAQTVRFTVDAPGPLSVEMNGQIRPALLLFIDPPEESTPPPDAPGVVRFAGGKLHEAGEIRLASDQTLYLEPGAVVDCPERYHRRNPKRHATGAGQWVPWERLTNDEQTVSRQNRGEIRNVRLTEIQLLERIPPRSFLVNSGGKLAGVTFQNVRHREEVLARSEDLGLSVEGATDVWFVR